MEGYGFEFNRFGGENLLILLNLSDQAVCRQCLRPIAIMEVKILLRNIGGDFNALEAFHGNCAAVLMQDFRERFYHRHAIQSMDDQRSKRYHPAHDVFGFFACYLRFCRINAPGVIFNYELSYLYKMSSSH